MSTVVIGKQLKTVSRFSDVYSGSSNTFSSINFFTEHQLHISGLFAKRHTLICISYENYYSYESQLPRPKSHTKAGSQIPLTSKLILIRERPEILIYHGRRFWVLQIVFQSYGTLLTKYIEVKTAKMCFEFAANKIYVPKILLPLVNSCTNVFVWKSSYK